MTPRPKALTLVAFGARGTGKTEWVKQQIKRDASPRLMVWDFKHDEALESVGVAHTGLGAFITAAKAPRFALRYLVDHGRNIDAQFDLFCRAAWEAGNLQMFVDELPEVSKPGRPPPVWRKCINVGRSYKGSDGKLRSLSIIGAAQRPAETDKAIISNADVIHTGRLNNLEDARQMANSLGCDYRTLMSLPDLHWVEKDAKNREFSTGVLTFYNKKPASKPKPKG